MSDPSAFKRKFLKVSLWFSLILTLFLYVELPAKFFRFPDYQSPFHDIYGYETIAKEADAVFKGNNNPRKGLAVSNWTMGSRMMYYALPYKMPVFVIDERKDQFDLWQSASPEGYDLLFLNTHFTNLDLDKAVTCDQVRPMKSIDSSLNGAKIDTVEYVWCMNYRGFKK